MEVWIGPADHPKAKPVLSKEAIARLDKEWKDAAGWERMTRMVVESMQAYSAACAAANKAAEVARSSSHG